MLFYNMVLYCKNGFILTIKIVVLTWIVIGVTFAS